LAERDNLESKFSAIRQAQRIAVQIAPFVRNDTKAAPDPTWSGLMACLGG
jgi:hypothetical protein